MPQSDAGRTELLGDLRRLVLLHRLEHRDSSAAEISRVVDLIDPLRAVLLEQVRSSYYALEADVTVHRAVVAVGIDRVTTLALSEARRCFTERPTLVQPAHVMAASYAAAAAMAFGAPALDGFPIGLCRAVLTAVPEDERDECGAMLTARIGLMRLDRILGDWTVRGSLSPALERSVALGLNKAGLGPATSGVADFDAAAQSRARRIEAMVARCFEVEEEDASIDA